MAGMMLRTASASSFFGVIVNMPSPFGPSYAMRSKRGATRG